SNCTVEKSGSPASSGEDHSFTFLCPCRRQAVLGAANGTMRRKRMDPEKLRASLNTLCPSCGTPFHRMSCKGPISRTCSAPSIKKEFAPGAAVLIKPNCELSRADCPCD